MAGGEHEFLDIEREPSTPTESIFEIERDPTETLDDIFGLEEAKATARKIALGCAHPEYFEKYGGQRTRSVFFDGDPGTGKSTLVRAMAHEIGALTGEPVDLLTLTAASIYQHVRGPEFAIEEAFRQARRYTGQAVLFLNEADGLMTRHNIDASSAQIRVASICKVGLEKVTENQQLTVAAATNNIRGIDPGIWAPHRFNERKHLGRPEFRQVVDMLGGIVRDRRYGNTSRPVFDPSIRPDMVLNRDLQFTPGQLVEAVRRAQEKKILEAIAANSGPGQVTQAELEAAILEYKAEGTN